ncbi:MAG: hypothetical protein AAF959_24690 [Cyanobacteria bacterium P01_D01_bin.56]
MEAKIKITPRLALQVVRSLNQAIPEWVEQCPDRVKLEQKLGFTNLRTVPTTLRRIKKGEIQLRSLLSWLEAVCEQLEKDVTATELLSYNSDMQPKPIDEAPLGCVLAWFGTDEWSTATHEFTTDESGRSVYQWRGSDGCICDIAPDGWLPLPIIEGEK